MIIGEIERQLATMTTNLELTWHARKLCSSQKHILRFSKQCYLMSWRCRSLELIANTTMITVQSAELCGHDDRLMMKYST